MSDEQQQVEQEQEATDADLIAAVQEAGGTEAVDVEAEAEAAGQPPPVKPEPAAATPAAPATDADEPKIAAVIRAREKAFQERQQAEDYAAQLRQRAELEAKQIREEARAKAERDHADWLTQQQRRFQENPTEAIRALAKDPQDIVDAVIRDGTPEARAMREMQQRIAEAEKRAAVGEQAKTEFEQFKLEQQQLAHAQRVEQVKTSFLSTHASPEKTPYLYKRYDAEEIFAKANAKAIEWQKAGVPFDHADVAQYLEHESRKRILGEGSSTPQQVSGGNGNATKVKANGSRTLSSAAGSERRASPKPIEEMTAEEERAALMAEVAAARRTTGS